MGPHESTPMAVLDGSKGKRNRSTGTRRMAKLYEFKSPNFILCGHLLEGVSPTKCRPAIMQDV